MQWTASGYPLKPDHSLVERPAPSASQRSSELGSRIENFEVARVPTVRNTRVLHIVTWIGVAYYH